MHPQVFDSCVAITVTVSDLDAVENLLWMHHLDKSANPPPPGLIRATAERVALRQRETETKKDKERQRELGGKARFVYLSNTTAVRQEER